MNPEDNNQLNNPGNDPLSGIGAMPGVGNLSTSDSLASAQDNLTSAGLAAGDNNGVMGLDQIGASAPEAVMAPPVNEPLVPAAPVPGSIGSVTSVPPIEPQPAPVAEPAAPYNPFAPQPTPAPESAAATEPFATPATPEQPAPAANPFAQPAAPQPTPAGMAPVQPMPGLGKLGDAKSSIKSPITIIALVAAALFLISTIVFVVLWRKAVDNTRIVYVPAVSEDSGAATPESVALICQRDVPAQDIIDSGDANIVSGKNTTEIAYYDGDIEGINTTTDLVYIDAEQAEIARANAEANWPALQELMGINGNTLTPSYTADGNVFTTSFALTTEDESWTRSVLGDLGVASEDNDHTVAHVKSTAEANGYTCIEE